VQCTEGRAPVFPGQKVPVFNKSLEKGPQKRICMHQYDKSRKFVLCKETKFSFCAYKPLIFREKGGII
jgi:hypothetical protein